MLNFICGDLEIGFTKAGDDFPDQVKIIVTDGTAFCTGFFMVESNFSPDIKRFELSFSPDFSAFDDLRWAMCYRPEVADGSLIQTAPPERFIERGSSRKLEKGIFPQVNFNARQQHGNSIYAEFFMEAGNTISGQKDENCSSITWEKGNPVLSWNFQNKPRRSNQLPWQWRNLLFGGRYGYPKKKRKIIAD